MPINSKQTPYYLIDLKKVECKYHEFEDAIKSLERNDIIAYSVKANYNQAIIKCLENLGSWFEVCSQNEYDILIKYGIENSKIIVNGCFFDDFDKYKDSILIVDTYPQLYKWVQEGSKVKIGIRVNLDCYTKDERFINKKSRFGVNMQSKEVKKLLKKANKNNIIVLHCHLAGNSRIPSIYRDVVKYMSDILENHKLKEVRYFDIGGGYKIGDGFWKFSDYVKSVHDVCPEQISLIFEPGNSLVRDCALYCTRIIANKRNGNEENFIADGSSLQVPKMCCKNIDYRIEPNENVSKRYSGDKIYGNTCKESDLILQAEEKFNIGVGDYLIIENVGAYSVNEVNSMILGHPNIYIKNTTNVYLGKRIFKYLCKYKDCYMGKRNNYSKINNIMKKGLYAFINKRGEVIYIGVAHNRELKERIKQHFRNGDTGSLRKKLDKKQIKELENSSLYVCEMKAKKKELLYEEAYLIGMYRPKFNFR